jgi:hypothetical protein
MASRSKRGDVQRSGTGLNIDEYFARSDSNGTVAYLPDALGSTIGLVNSSGAIGTSYTYRPFGAVTASGNPSSSSYQFTGRENDDKTRLYYYRARYYSPRCRGSSARIRLDFLVALVETLTSTHMYGIAQLS